MAAKIVKASEKLGIGYFKAGFFGKAGSGKTMTMLLFAEHLARLDPQKRGVLFIDTEAGAKWYRQAVPEREVHPAPFEFDWVNTRSLFDVIDLVENEAANYSVICIDSVTHLWQAAQEAYAGKRLANGSLPIQAWAQVKKPWARMMQLGLNGSFHFQFAGREGLMTETTDDGEMKVTGVRMKAESEAQFEPDVLGHMTPETDKSGRQVVRIFFVKDRSGILAGKTFANPDGRVIAPLVGYLGGEQQPVDDTEKAAERDAEAAAAHAERVEAERKATYDQILGAINAAHDLPSLKSAWELTKGKKTKLGEDLFTSLETAKDARKSALVEAA